MLNFLKRNTSIIQRYFHLSEIFSKRPPHHRSKFRSIRPFPFFKSYYDNDGAGPLEVTIDEIKTLPPGRWGSMPINKAWKLYKESKCLRELPTYFDKLESLTWTEHNTWYHTLQLPLSYPETLNFSQFLTRTTVLDDVPDSVKDSFNNVSSEEISRTSHMLKMHLENYFVQTSPFLSRFDHEERRRQSNEFIIQMMDTIARSRNDNAYFVDYSTSPNSTIETFMKRTGYDKLEASENVKDADGFVKYKIKGNLAWQLRSKDLLKEFVKVNDQSTVNDGNNFPIFDYHPKMFNLEPLECEAFRHLPYTYSIHTNEYARNIPGYWGSSPFKVGDPCAYSVLGVLNTDLDRDFNDRYRSGHQDILDRHNKSNAILAGFTWTMAQAQNQGFTIYDELSFPFCSCLLLTNGHQIQMAYYQLNSISSLLKPEDANISPNMFWTGPKIDLFDLDSSGKIVDIDEHAIHQILATFTMPKSDLSSEELRPFLMDKDPRDCGDLMIHFDRDNATEKELEEYMEKSRHRRIFRYGKSHPNRMFYVEKATKYDMNEDLRQIVPAIGRVPTKIATEIREHKLIREKVRQGKKKVLKEPSKWQ